jgi:hypothetical protein
VQSKLGNRLTTLIAAELRQVTSNRHISK